MMRSLKLLLTVALLFAIAATAFGQVTTSAITGTVKDAQGQPLIGATVKATHVPSGTVYGTTTLSNGSFTIPGMRVGGPYEIQISYVGYQPKIIKGISLTLGEPFVLNETLSQSGQQLSEVTVVASGGKLNQERTGASTIISSQQLAALPSISRGIADFTRLTPQSDGYNFAGRDGRYNNLQVDGVNLNNSFGLSTDPMPGGGASPISLDAYQEVSVNIAPYDVRQSGFTGAGINAVTKSGTNTFHGSVYGYYRNQNFNGDKVDGQALSTTPQSHKTFGFDLGGPIIKNKLFFFVNGELENASAPGISYVPAGSGLAGNPSTTPVDSLKALSNFLKDKYQYNTGAYQNFPNFVTKNHKILAKVDWNISTKHKLTVKYTDFRGSDMSPLNGSSVPTGGKFLVTGLSSGLSRLPNNRFSDKSMSFANSNYGTNHTVQTASVELNSNFNSKMANQFIGTYTHVSDIRYIPGGQVFPTIDIFNGQGQNQLSAGNDPFTNNNEVINNVVDITDNFTLYEGSHTFTFGGTYEHQRVGNMFMGGSSSYYIYNSLNDFLNGAPPAYYGLAYAYYGASNVFSANLKLGQVGIYAQDQFQINNKLNLTYGIRADIPVFGPHPIENPAITALEFPDEKGVMTHYNTGKWPNTSILLSPRIGFRWDVMGDKSLILRGGTGIFTGKIPFVFLTNMPSNNGMYQNTENVSTPAAIAQDGIVFNPKPGAYKDLFPQKPNGTTSGNFVLIDPHFKFPMVWRTDIGADKSLGNGFTASADLMFTKDIHAVKMRNVNLMPPTNHLNGLDQRLYYTEDEQKDGANLYYPALGQDIILENTSKGYSYLATIQISKSFSNGFFGNIAYTYTKSKEVSPNPGSRATSAWQSIANVGPTNAVELGNSEYAIPSRIVADASYRFEYTHHMSTTISLFYQGMSLNNYNFVYGGNSIVGDGNQHLMYIYKSGADVPFVPITDKNGNVTSTVAQQQQAYDQFINSNPYLKKHKGQYASRNAVLTPWYNELDLAVRQDFFITTKGGTRHTLEVSLDLINLPNLISNKWKNWGYSQKYTITNPLVFKGVDSKGEPQFQMNKYNGQLATQAFAPNISSSVFNPSLSTPPQQVWGIQLGLRYKF